MRTPPSSSDDSAVRGLQTSQLVQTQLSYLTGLHKDPLLSPAARQTQRSAKTPTQGCPARLLSAAARDFWPCNEAQSRVNVPPQLSHLSHPEEPKGRGQENNVGVQKVRCVQTCAGADFVLHDRLLMQHVRGFMLFSLFMLRSNGVDRNTGTKAIGWFRCDKKFWIDE